MKRILASALLLLAVGVSFAAVGTRPVAVTAGNAPFVQVAQNPEDVVWLTLHDNLPTSADTFAAADTSQVYGPFVLTAGKGDPMFKAFRVYFIGGLTSGDSVQIAYQIISGSKMSDTIASGWTVVDTVTDGGKVMAQVDISAKPGRAIVFKITNVDSTAVNIINWVRVALRRAITFSESR
jgi:hypothetical protein